MQVVSLDKKLRSDIVDALCQAFTDYPVMRFVIGESSDYQQKLESLIGFYVDKRLAHNWPVLGIYQRDTLAGVSLISPPEIPDPVIIRKLESDLLSNLGDEAMQREQLFENTSEESMPHGEYHFVGMLGVVPEFQGRGIGKILLDEIKRMSKEAKLEGGVCLSTEDPKNIPYYQSVGFEILSKTRVGALTTWTFQWKEAR